ncbi:SDR family NAD(P)-dependent oxidoreductase [Streptomyces sp. F001]|uniref:SDR family NAD(P)-dependent oxidoreductase n=1 Tax=Streptomyces sp. F001 TaxID=1510026 RepID=UPI0013EE44ED|nr:SDR family NAD(P)-dependent oxidoreductase [Streptomyces sp. F001]
MLQLNLEGRTAFVTGVVETGLRHRTGVARAWCQGGDRSEDEAAVKAAAGRLITGSDAEGVLPVVADVTDADSVNSALAEAHAWQGGLDILVNNAGPQLAPTPWTRSTRRSSRRLRHEADRVHSRRAAALPFLSRTGSGSIVNVVGATAHMLIPMPVLRPS